MTGCWNWSQRLGWSLAIMLGLSQGSFGQAIGDNPFFAMCTGTKDEAHATPAAQVAMVKELGYAGTDLIGVAGLKDVLEAIDGEGSRFLALYTPGRIDPNSRNGRRVLEDALALLEGRIVSCGCP